MAGIREIVRPSRHGVAGADMRAQRPEEGPLGRATRRLRGLGRTALVVAVIGLSAMSGIGAWLVHRHTDLPEDAAFAFGERIVTTAEVEDRIDALGALYGIERPTEPATLDDFRRRAAKSLAVSLVLDRAARERHVTPDDKQAREALDRLIGERFAGDRASFLQALSNVGASESQVLDEIKRQLAVARLFTEVVGDTPISDAQLVEAFKTRRPELGTPERRTLRNIVVGTEEAARDALAQLHAGTPFEQVAVSRSLDGSSSRGGGAIGDLTRQQLEPAVGDVAFSAPEGGLYGPVKGRYGFNVGRVDRVIPAVPATFEAVCDGLRETLRTEEAMKRWRNWLDRELNAAGVRYADAYAPSYPDPATGLAGEGTMAPPGQDKLPGGPPAGPSDGPR